jgi:hypothetical protein
MRYQSLALLAMACSIVLAREDTAELCTGTLSCDEGYCCSSQYVQLIPIVAVQSPHPKKSNKH